MATMARSEIQKALKLNHQELVEGIAEWLQPRFQSGEFRGYLEKDFAGVSLTAPSRSPFDLLIEELEAVFVPTLEDAHLVLACSPQVKVIDGSIGLAQAKWAAADCLAREVLLLARRRGWSVPQAGEGPDLAA